MAEPVAVVLLNLGGPDSLAAVEPFLRNLFSDPDIFRLPLGRLTQRPFARFISHRRAPEARKGYAAIGGRSPLLTHTLAQAQALEAALRRTGVPVSRSPGMDESDRRTGVPVSRTPGTAWSDCPHDDFRVRVCMRYWHPLSGEVVADLQSQGYERVLLLPLYPQYSRTTTGSSVHDFERACARAGYRPRLSVIAPWFDDPGYAAAVAEDIRAQTARFPDPDPAAITLLLSAHGLPKKLSAEGDPYEQQVEATAAAVQARLGWPDVTLCYQSRVGPLEWLRPYTDQVIRERGAGGCRQMLVYPIAFVSDHVETLYELGQVYADLARVSGIRHYRVAPALNASPRLIAVLRDRVLAAMRDLEVWPERPPFEAPAPIGDLGTPLAGAGQESPCRAPDRSPRVAESRDGRERRGQGGPGATTGR